MFPAVISRSNSTSENHASIISSGISRVQADFGTLNSMLQNNSLNPSQQQPLKTKKKRNLPGNPDPDAEVIALSPKTLLATNRFVCEICNKGFQRDQNLQLHRRGHNLPWKLKQRNSKEIKKRAYVCPEPTCLHHHSSRALGDLTGIKKHYCRKHGEKKWKCEKCSKIYAVRSDWKAHSKTCGTREYRCDCGTLFSRKDSFITHRAFCDALAQESARLSAAANPILSQNPNYYNITTTAAAPHFHFDPQNLPPPPAPNLLPFSARRHPWDPPSPENPNHINSHHARINQIQNIKHESLHTNNHVMTSPFGGLHVTTIGSAALSATALLQEAAAAMGSARVGRAGSTMAHLDMRVAPAWRIKNDYDGGDDVDDDRLTRDFLGVTGDHNYASYGYGFTETCSGWGGNC